MAIPLKVGTNGRTAQLGASDVLDIDDIDRRAGSGNMTLGASLGASEELVLGSATSDVRVLGDLLVDGSETVSTDETVVGVFSANGDVNLGNNDGDVISLGGGSSDVINLNADLVVGAGTLTIGSSVTDFLDDIFLDAVNANGPALAAYGLNVSGTNAGAYAIGVDPSLLVNATATDLMTALDEMDAAISAGGSETLQETYELGNTIDVTSAEGTITFRNNTTSDTTTVLTLIKAPGAGTAGTVLDVSTGANASGTMAIFNNLGSGSALKVQDAGVDVLDISAAGAVLVTPISGQNATITVAGAGVVDINSAAEITIDAGAASNFSTSAGNLTLDAAAAELVFDDQGNSALTLSETGDRVLDLAGAGEVFNGVTSMIGGLNALGRRISDSGELQTEIAIENTVVVAAGDVIAASTTASRVTQANANADTNGAIVGIAQTGGTGDVGGTVLTRFWLPGSVVTDSGASFTAGSALYAPDGTGRATHTAPTDIGDLRVRIGWALNATQFVFQPTEGIIL